MKTRQAVLVEPGRFEIREAEVDLPPDGVLVEMSGCGLCTWELNHWAGRLGKPPQPLGHEGFGVAVEVGKACARIKAGDRVTGLGSKAFADYFVIPEPHAMKLTTDQKLVPGEPLYCVQNVLRAAHPEIGDSVAVVGCGPMGQWAIQGLAAPWLHSLIAIDIDEKKLALAKAHGATHAVNPKNGGAEEQVLAITGGRGADVAVEGTGGPAGVQTAIDVLRGRNPRLVIMSSFKKPVETDLVKLCAKAVNMIHAHPGIAKDLADGCRRTEILINHGVFKTDALVSHRFALEEITQAFHALESRPEGYLKGIVVR